MDVRCNEIYLVWPNLDQRHLWCFACEFIAVGVTLIYVDASGPGVPLDRTWEAGQGGDTVDTAVELTVNRTNTKILNLVYTRIYSMTAPGSPRRIGLFFVRLLSICTVLRISSSRPITGSSLPSRAACVKSRLYFESACATQVDEEALSAIATLTTWRLGDAEDTETPPKVPHV